jgi:nucleoside-diphosphate-sugar epimerase
MSLELGNINLMGKIFITGSTGFVGSHLITAFKKRSISFIAGDRSLYGDLVTQNNWEELLLGSDCVVHLAGRVHVMNEKKNDSNAQFHLNNVVATLNLANAAKKSGVKRFIFISSVKVNGEETYDRPFKSCDVPSPRDPYGFSKLEAENELLKLHESRSFEVVIIRPSLIYGQGVKANFAQLYSFVGRDLPIPFGLVKNKRSLVSVLNLVDLIITTLTHPSAGGEIFMASDDCDLSLPELINLMAKVQGKYAHLLPVPIWVMKLGALLLGKKSYTNRLFGNLQVDIEKTKELLSWEPPFTFEETYHNL